MPSLLDPYLVIASQLYSSAFFGRQDPDAWLQCFLPIVATATTYRNKTSTPNSKKSSTKYWEAVNEIISSKLAGKTVSQVIKTVEEALIRLIIIKHLISTIFKDHLDVLVYLLKQQSSLGAAPSDVILEQAMNNAVLPVTSHYVPSITLPPVSKYTTPDIKFFIKLHNQIKLTERLEDKKRDNSDADKDADGSPLVLAFVQPELPLAGSSPTAAGGNTKRRKVTSPSGANIKVASGAMELFCDSSDDD